MDDLFLVYVAVDPTSKDAPVAAAKLTKDNIRKLAKITGATEVWKKVRGGSMVISELLLNGFTVKIGDYIISDTYNTHRMYPRDFFETRYKPKGPMSTVERR